jgi:hypothetical protein
MSFRERRQERSASCPQFALLLQKRINEDWDMATGQEES